MAAEDYIISVTNQLSRHGDTLKSNRAALEARAVDAEESLAEALVTNERVVSTMKENHARALKEVETKLASANEKLLKIGVTLG